ncbi:MAG TPA: hypothetical protein VF847_02455 [Candidatus Deferrimicrobiaceae bacterium]
MRKIGLYVSVIFLGIFISIGAASLVGILFPGLKEVAFFLSLAYWILAGRQHLAAIDLFR